MIISLVIKSILILVLLLGKQQQVLGDIAPPVDVQATQASVSAPVEISWNPPAYSISLNTSDQNVTGYRIFFDNGEDFLLPPIITYVGVLTRDIMIGQQISIRSEAELDGQLIISELINVTVTRSGQSRSNTGRSEPNAKAAAIALGVVLVIVVIVAGALVTLILLKRLNRTQSTMSLRKSYYKLRKHFVFKDPNMSENVAYNSVRIAPSESTIEDFETLVIGTEDGNSGQDTQPHPTYETVNYSEMVD